MAEKSRSMEEPRSMKEPGTSGGRKVSCKSHHMSKDKQTSRKEPKQKSAETQAKQSHLETQSLACFHSVF